MQIGIVGVGAVGSCWARELRDRWDGELALADPFPSHAAQEWAAGQGLYIGTTPAAAAHRSQIVLICVPGSALKESVQSVKTAAAPNAVLIDLTTANPDAKVVASREAAQAGLRYVDAAITGAVGLTGARTPLLVAGNRYADVEALFAAVGAPAQYLTDSQPGDAVRVKLLRSVVMKGIEALAVEVLPAARNFGLLEQLFATMSDVDNRPFTELLQAMITSHPAQARRRYIETEAAAMQLQAGGFSATLTKNVAEAFARTAERFELTGAPQSSTFTRILDWLTESQRRNPAAIGAQEARA